MNHRVLNNQIQNIVNLLDSFVKIDHCVSLSKEAIDYFIETNSTITKDMCGQYYLDDVETHWGFNP